MFLTGKHMSRRTALRGLGATIALPLLDSMIPARTVFAQTAAGRAASRTRLVCIEQVHGAAGCSEYGATQNSLESRRDRPQLRPEQEQPQPARAVPQPPDHRQQHRHAHGRGVHRRRSRRRPLPLERRDVHARAPEAHGRVGRPRRHVDGPAVRRRSSARTRRFRRCSSASSRSISPAAAPTATPASTPTRSAGPRRISRCRWCAIRAWCSSRCSAPAARRSSARSAARPIAASSTC